MAWRGLRLGRGGSGWRSCGAQDASRGGHRHQVAEMEVGVESEVRCRFRAWTWAVGTRREGSGCAGQSLLPVPGPPQFIRRPGPGGLEGPGGGRGSLEKAALRFSRRSLPELSWQFSKQAREKRNRKYPAPGPASQGSETEMFRRGEGRGKSIVCG